MVPEINYWAVLIATASSMVVGSIWYARKVFGTRWAKLANVDMDRPGASAVMPIVVTVVVSFITAWVLAGATAIAWHFYGGGVPLDPPSPRRSRCGPASPRRGSSRTTHSRVGRRR